MPCAIVSVDTYSARGISPTQALTEKQVYTLSSQSMFTHSIALFVSRSESCFWEKSLSIDTMFLLFYNIVTFLFKPTLNITIIFKNNSEP